MTYSKEAQELLDDTLKEMIRIYGGSTAYAKMVGYLMVNVDLATAKRIAKHEDAKYGGK
jgi:hypothetical protein